MADGNNLAGPAGRNGSGIRPMKKSFLSGHGSVVNAIIMVAIIILLMLGGLVLYVQGQVKALPVVNATPVGPISGSLSISQYGILTYNNSNYLVGYVKAKYYQANSSVSNLTLSIYPSNPSEPVYLVNLDGYCMQCFIGSSLFVALNSSMHRYGLYLNSSSLNYVDINKLSTMPNNSVVIIPSGLIPEILLPNSTYNEKCANYENISIMTLLGNGDTVIYVGRNFSRSVSCSGQVIQNTLPEYSALLPYSNFTALNPSNSVFFFSTPTFALKAGSSLGHVYSTPILNGTLVLFSDYPSAGWNNSVNNLASDIAKALKSRFWITPIATGTLQLPGTNSGTPTLFTTNTAIKYYASVSEEINSSYALLMLNLSNPSGFQDLELPFRYGFRQNGLLSMPAVVGLSQPLTVAAQVFNQSQSATVSTFVSIFSSNLTSAQSNPIYMGQTGPQAVYEFPQFFLPSGYYIARLNDQKGSVYSSALFYVSNSSITQSSFDFPNATFTFLASSNGHPISGVAYTASINNAYQLNGIIQNGAFKYSLPKGTYINHGNGTFSVEIMGENYSVPYSYPSSTAINIPPLYVAFVVAAIVIIVLNKVLVPPNVDDYYIDVPDIKPAKLDHAKESADSVVSVFDKVNVFYRWHYMPLTAEEVKSGISNNIKYGNTRMTITLRNTYSILNYLVEKDIIKMADDYYAPSRWIKESGYSMEYLTIYRKLKDYCISNAMLMTELGAASKADVIVTNKGTQNYVKIYSSDMRVRDIEINQKTKAFLVFLDEEARLTFLDKLYRSYGKNAEIIKMAIAYGNLKLIDSYNLSQLKL